MYTLQFEHMTLLVDYDTEEGYTLWDGNFRVGNSDSYVWIEEMAEEHYAKYLAVMEELADG